MKPLKEHRLGSDPFWLIEHQNYGVLWNWEYVSPPQPRFSWNLLRTQGIIFHSKGEALAALKLCRESGRAGMTSCYLLKWDGKNMVHDMEVR